MPRYDYLCSHCDLMKEYIRKFDSPSPACPECNGEMERQLSVPAVARVKGGTPRSHTRDVRKVRKTQVNVPFES